MIRQGEEEGRSFDVITYVNPSPINGSIHTLNWGRAHRDRDTTDTTYEENPPLENPELNVWDDIDRI